jgi:UDP-N-acetyl-D-mannosaminuronic acid dehydrogenase
VLIVATIVRVSGTSPLARDLVVIGGCGHVGLPLAIAFADHGARVGIYDVCAGAVEQVSAGRMPFAEPGAGAALARSLAAGRLTVTTDPAIVGTAGHLVLVTGTPVDEHLRPDQGTIPAALRDCAPHLRDGQLLILRSTVHPGGTALVEKLVSRLGRDIDVAFCPERIAEGRAMTELAELPQIVASRSQRGCDRAAALFTRLTSRIIVLTPEEAELAKLFTNIWRYIKFGAANQLYMMANDRGGFGLGHAAMAVNEGLPAYLVQRLEQRFELASMTVGILGMAFKASCDDTRSSLSYVLKRILAARAGAVVCTDPYGRADPDLRPLAEVLAASDLVIIATPHPDYAGLQISVPVADPWNVLGRGALV